MEAIAKEAGVGIGTLYRHFPRRIDVVEAMYRDDVDALVRCVDRFAAELEPWDALVAWVRAYMDYAQTKRTFLSELQEAFEKNPDLKPATRERILEAFNRVLSRAQKAGSARRGIDGADLMQLLWPMCASPTLAPEQAERLLPLVFDGLKPPVTPRPLGKQRSRR
jgi:AcrR family transcriptional regulator